MIKITKPDDVSKIKDVSVIPYINNLVSSIINSYCANRSFEAVGAIYFLENKDDIKRYEEMNLSSPLTCERFEWVENIGNGYSDGCVVINNDFAINIIGKTEYFNKEDSKNERGKHS